MKKQNVFFHMMTAYRKSMLVFLLAFLAGGISLSAQTDESLNPTAETYVSASEASDLLKAEMKTLVNSNTGHSLSMKDGILGASPMTAPFYKKVYDKIGEGEAVVDALSNSYSLFANTINEANPDAQVMGDLGTALQDAIALLKE